jgi:hypothetical protein
MTVTSAYMYTVKNLPAMFEAIQKAQVPPRFTHEFLQTLGFKSTNDRAFINVLKGLGLLDSNAVPTQVYRDYRDKAVAKRILAQQIRTAYQGLYMTDENAHDLSVEAVKGKLNSLTGKDETVVAKMATTFSALAKLADFKESLAPKKVTTPEEEIVESPALAPTPSKQLQGIAFSHVVYINLPATHDVAVYNAIFKSIKEHLL